MVNFKSEPNSSQNFPIVVCLSVGNSVVLLAYKMLSARQTGCCKTYSLTNGKVEHLNNPPILEISRYGISSTLMFH